MTSSIRHSIFIPPDVARSIVKAWEAASEQASQLPARERLTHWPPKGRSPSSTAYEKKTDVVSLLLLQYKLSEIRKLAARMESPVIVKTWEDVADRAAWLPAHEPLPRWPPKGRSPSSTVYEKKTDGIFFTIRASDIIGYDVGVGNQ